MIERICRVLCKCDGVDPDASLLPANRFGWAWQAYKDKAVCVLSEMRSASDQMEASGTIAILEGENSRVVFRDMISVALRE